MRSTPRIRDWFVWAAARPWYVGSVLILLWVVSVVFLNDMRRALEFDEAIYLSEATSSIDPIGFGPHRARGIVWLIAPVASLGGSLLAIRWYLLAITLLGLVLIAAAWWPLVRWWAIWGTAIFAWHWLVLFYAIEISPNLFAAMAVVVSIGLSIRNILAPSKQTMVLADLALFVAVLIRPTDCACVLAGLVPAMLLFGRSGRKTALALSSAFAIGIIPWLIESYARWGGVIDRLRLASPAISVGDAAPAGIQHLYLLNGPLMGPDPANAVSKGAAVYVIVLAVLFGIQLFGARHNETRRLVTLIAAGALTLLAFYAFGPGASAPRFLLPCYGLLIMGSTLGSLAKMHFSTGALAIGLVLLGLSTPWHFRVANSIAQQQQPLRLDSADVGTALAEIANAQPCSFGSQYGHPQISAISGCSGTIADPLSLDAPRLPGEGWAHFVVLVSTPPPESPLNTWESTTLVGTSGTTFTIYIEPDSR